MFAYSCLTRLIGNGNPAVNDAYTYITSLQLPSVIIIRPVTDVHVMLKKIVWERRVRQNVAKERLSVIYTFR